MKKILLILAVLGIGIVQTSGAAETTFKSNNSLSHTVTNTSNSDDYRTRPNIYSSSKSSGVYNNNDIAQSIDNLSAYPKQKKYRSSLQTVPNSLENMKKWANQGSAKYQIMTGWIYYSGQGVRQDMVLARKMFGGVLKSMLASDVAIIDIEEHQIEYLKVIIKLFREAAGFSNGST
ncbi:hypothetical protein M0N77_05515 [Psychrobacter sp. AH5]